MNKSPKPTLRCLELENYPILRQLQLEEALLRADDQNWCLVNTGSPPAVVMGISGKADELIDFDHIGRPPLPIIRRFSGGGTVVVDEDTLFITMICAAQTAGIPPFPQHILGWNGAFYQEIFRQGEFRVQENDYAIGDRKCGGNAQYICKERWLHHSTLLWDYDPKRMKCLKMPPKIPAYRRGRGHEAFLCKIRPFFPHKDHFFQRFRQALSIRFTLLPVSLEDTLSYLEKPHRKATVCL